MPLDTNNISGNLIVGGYFQCGQFVIPAQSVGDAQIDPVNPISHANYKPRIIAQVVQGEVGTALVTKTMPLRISRGTGNINSVIKATCLVAPVGASTVNVVIRKNGVSITGTPINITSANLAFGVVTGVLNALTYLANDVFDAVITVAGAGTPGQGLIVSVDFLENTFTG